mgnify:CR=1 FL=1
MDVNTCKRFGHSRLVDGRPRYNEDRWGAFIRVEGWVYAIYWAGTAFCTPCPSSEAADELFEWLRDAMDGLWPNGGAHCEKTFISMCEKAGWQHLYYYGEMSTTIDGQKTQLPIPTCAY